MEISNSNKVRLDTVETILREKIFMGDAAGRAMAQPKFWLGGMFVVVAL